MSNEQAVRELNAQLGNKASEARDAFRIKVREKNKADRIRVVHIVTHHINNRDDVGGCFSVY